MEKQLVPQLRFSDFDCEYVKYEFSELAKRSKRSYKPNKDFENLPCIELESLTQETGQLIKTFDSTNLKSNKTRFSSNEVLFGKLRPYLRKYLLTSFAGVCTSEIWVFQGKLVTNPFLYYLIQTEKFNYEANVSSGSKMPRTDWDYLSGIRFSIPNLSEEQQKIASFLTDVDAKITQLTKKKILLEHYKKGIMQKIFNQELRFKDDEGKEFPDWEEKKLGGITTINMGQSPDSSSYNNKGDGYYLIQGNADILNRKTSPRNWTNDPTKLCDVGDLILTVRAPVGAIAKSRHKACIGRGVCSIKNKKTSNIEFIYQFLLDYEKRWARLEQGSTFSAVSGKDIKSVEINLPSLEEQNKIANFLSDIDEKIEALNTKIENTQTFKKGLLQQMFV